MDQIIDGLQWLIDYFNTGIYGFVKETLQEMVSWLVIAKLEAQIFMLEFSWGVAKNVLINLGVSQIIETAWSGIDSDIMGYLNFFRVPDALNIILQAYTTKIVLKVMGW
jgi:hypothetical protein